jgi:hypothetical protein
VEDETQAKILQLLDVISVEVAATRTELCDEFRREIGGLRNETRRGFERVDHRLGNLEIRVENVETELRDFRGEFERRIAPLEH